MDDLGIDDAVTGAQIRLGMTKAEVEKLLGAPDDEIMGRDLYNGLQVYYRDDKAAGLIVAASDNETNRYRTHREIGLGSSYREILSQYGGPQSQEPLYNDIAINYVFSNNNGTLEKVTKPITPVDNWNLSETYYISILLFNLIRQEVSYPL
ncbi:hypothetical protein ACX1C1_03035 [Paenibacillus sp. strain BS8-2]